MCDEKWIIYNNWQWSAQWVDWEESSKALPKAKLGPQKRSWSLFGGLLPVWSTTAFWIPTKPLHLRIMLSKSMRCTKNCKACSQHWSTEWAQFSSRQCLTAEHVTQAALPKLTRSATALWLIGHFHLTSREPTATSSSISTTFCRENASPTSRIQKMLSKSSLNPEARIVMLREQTYFSLARMCWL